MNSGIALHNNATLTVEVNTFNIPSNTLNLHNEFIVDSETQSLWFFSGKSAWSGMIVRNGLFTNYHYDYVSPLFLTRNRRLSLTAYLPSYLLETIKLNDVLSYKNKEYRINSLTTELQSGKSTIQLEGFETEEKPILTKASNGSSPVITIVGNNPVELEYNTTYTDSGATVTDVEDDLNGYTTSLVDDSVNIDNTLFSTQYVTYTATDEDNNVTVAQREVVLTDSAIPVVDSWTRTYDGSFSKATLAFTVSSTGSPIKRVEVYIKRLNTPDPLTPFRTFLQTTSASFDYDAEPNNEYVAWIVAYNEVNQVTSSELSIILLT